MRKVIVTEFPTLDGVMEEPTPWQQGYSSPEIGQFKYNEIFQSAALLLGRVTYEGFAKYWPTAPGDFGKRMNSLPKFIASSHPEIIALIGYSWPGGLDGPAQQGARSLPENVREAFREIGAGIRAR